MNESLKIDKPKNFNLREILIINSISILPGSLLGISSVLFFLFFFEAFKTRNHIMFGLAFLLFIITGIVLFYSPAVLAGNPYVRIMVNKYEGLIESNKKDFIFQVSFTPRVHGGFRGFMEDADDIGYLKVSENSIIFAGDHVNFILPFTKIEDISLKNSGWRCLWLYGQRIKLMTNVLPNYQAIELVERQSNTLLSSKNITAGIVQKIKQLT